MARTHAQAAPPQDCRSGRVKDLVAGRASSSPARGPHELKGVPGSPGPRYQPANFSMIDSAAGPITTIIKAGKIKNSIGNSNFTGSLAAVSRAA